MPRRASARRHAQAMFQIALAEKVALLQERLPGADPLVLNYAGLLVARGRRRLAGDIAEEYERLLDAYHGIEHAEVITAVPLEGEETELLAQRLAGMVGERVVGAVGGGGDGIARIPGLQGARYNELLQFANGTLGIALNLEEDSVGAIVLGDYSAIKEGDEVRTTGRIVEVPVGDGLKGRVVDPLGRAIDGKGPIQAGRTRPGG